MLAFTHPCSGKTIPQYAGLTKDGTVKSFNKNVLWRVITPNLTLDWLVRPESPEELFAHMGNNPSFSTTLLAAPNQPAERYTQRFFLRVIPNLYFPEARNPDTPQGRWPGDDSQWGVPALQAALQEPAVLERFGQLQFTADDGAGQLWQRVESFMWRSWKNTPTVRFNRLGLGTRTPGISPAIEQVFVPQSSGKNLNRRLEPHEWLCRVTLPAFKASVLFATDHPDNRASWEGLSKAIVGSDLDTWQDELGHAWYEHNNRVFFHGPVMTGKLQLLEQLQKFGLWHADIGVNLREWIQPAECERWVFYTLGQRYPFLKTSGLLGDFQLDS